MTVVPPADAVVVDYDHHSARYADAWPQINAEIRSRCPVARVEQWGGFWLLTRYGDVAQAVKDDATFASVHSNDPDSAYQGVTIPPAPVRQIPIEMDPPGYLPYRQLLNPWFSPAASRRWEPMLRDIVTAFLNRIAPAGVGDLVLDVANPVPGVFTAMLLGLPVEDWRFYADPMHEIVFQPPGSPEHDRALVQYMGVLGKVAETIALRRTDPRDDLISLLATAEVGGAPLSDQTALEMASLVLIGGVDTTTGVLTNALLWLEEHPDVRARLAADPSLLPTATEEFLRYFTPTHALARTCTRDVEVGGVPLREGDRVLLSFAAANRDPEVFPDPDSVRFDREHYRHTTFGLGIHRCVGSTFARLEVQIVLEQMLRRFPDYRVDRARSERYPAVGIVNGWVVAPMTFTPGATEPTPLAF